MGMRGRAVISRDRYQRWRYLPDSGENWQEASIKTGGAIGRIDWANNGAQAATFNQEPCADVQRKGQALTKFALRSRFYKARDLAREAARKAGDSALADAVAYFQFRDLMAKAGTGKAYSAGMMEAQKQLGHQSIVMTQHYVRNKKVSA